MARRLTTTVRWDREDADALVRARAQGLFASRQIRQALRVVAAKDYRSSTGLFISTSVKLGDEASLFKDLEE